MNLTLIGWRNTAATILVEQLPLQDFDSALILVEGYLSSVGGWNPDNPVNPTGPGVPVSGDTPEEAAAAIVTQQYARIYNIDATATIKVNLKYHANLATGQTTESVLATLESTLQDFINNQVDETKLSLTSLDLITATITNNGFTTQAQRTQIQNNLVAAGSGSNDPRTLALIEARNRYNLDTTWNVYSLYTQPGEELVVMIRKYQTTAYATLDNAISTSYVIVLEPDHYLLNSGLVINA